MFFDTEKVEEVSGSFEPIPAGWYKTLVEGAAVKPTNAGGKQISVKFAVLDPNHSKRKLFGNFNIENKSAEAERIGKGQFKRFLKAIGITQGIKDPMEMQTLVTNKSLYILVGVEKHWQTGEPTNVVKDYNNEPKSPPHTATKAPVMASDPVLDKLPF